MYLAQRVDEAEVEHLVRLIQHQHFDAVQIEGFLIDQVEQATGRRDEDVGPAMQLVAVLVDRRAADDGMHLETRQRAVILGALGDLPGQFARRGEHQHPAGFERGLPVHLAQAIDAGEHEGGGLAGAGLRDAEQVAARKDGRDGLRLNRRRRRIALEVEGLKDGLRKPEI